MSQGIGEHSAVNATHHFKGAKFPASKEDLLLRARNNGAGQDTLEVLESFPNGRKFESLADVVSVFRQSDQVPQTGILERKA
jgi:poly(3-hydroxybutyrate) depolymerase